MIMFIYKFFLCILMLFLMIIMLFGCWEMVLNDLLFKNLIVNEFGSVKEV